MILEVVLFVLFLIFGFSVIRRPKHFPPGPSWLPIIGNNLQIKRLSRKLGSFHLALLELSRQYNTNVLGLKLGNELVVIVFSYPVIKAVLTSEEFNSRPINFFIELRCLGSIKGITCTDGEHWNIHKNFLLKNLRNLGFGKKETEQNIQNEIRDILNDIDQNEDVKIGKLVAPAVISVLWSVIAGYRFSKKDYRLNKLLDLFNRRSKMFDISGGILAQNPWLRFIAPEKTGYNIIKEINNELRELFTETIKHHQQTWIEGKDTDLIYLFISEMKKEDVHYSFTDDQLLMLCLDLFIAGSKTTSGVLEWAFLMMLHYPNVQEKIQHFLDKELHHGNSVHYADRQKFPYIEAVLLEVERYTSITPLIGPRKALHNTNLEGHIIPKNTTVLIHTHSVHMSPKHWEDPETFKPERFLTADGNVIRCDELLTFGLGKRRCIGESLAKTFIFIFFTEILKSYSVVQGSEKETFSSQGMVLSAEYSARFVKRHKSFN